MSNSIFMSISDIISVFGGNSAFARAIGVGASTASEMKRRGRIPAEYWRELIGAAKRLDHPEITADLLAELHARAPSSGSMPGFAEEGAVEPGKSSDPSGPAAPGLSSNGHFSRWKHLRQSHFASQEEVNAHIDALRQEWDRR